MRKRLIGLAGGLALAFVVHLLLWRMLPTVAPGVDVFLVATLLAAVGGPLQGMLVGVAAGALADSVSGTPFGVFGFANTLTGYTVGFAASKVAEMTEASVVILAALGALFQRLVLALVLAAFVSLASVPALWSPLAILTATVMVMVLRAFANNLTRLRLWRRSRRPGRLEL